MRGLDRGETRTGTEARVMYETGVVGLTMPLQVTSIVTRQ